MSDIKTAALNAPARALRFFGRFAVSLAAMALLQLALLAAGPVSSARAQQVTVACTIGDGLIDGGDILQMTFNTTTGVCVLTEVNMALQNPANGLKVLVNPGNLLLDVQIARFENGVTLVQVPGVDYSITNYTGSRIDSAGGVQFEENIPDAAGTSAISVTTLINGSGVTFDIAGVTKTDGTRDTTYTLVTFTYTPTSPSSADKANIADYLLSTFSQIDAGIFGPGGVPLSVATGAGGAGFSFTPNGGGSAGSGLSLGA